ncbi:complex I subunit 1/NuoH family protein [Desulfurispira natronophila]|uniref:NADH-quinone oxidoreductase subunit H n=1 Tax=Desulfurispira natronophila TaxID=682562 RepID=A0A7W7Y448_9BACT|nr:complex I subunit 1 family protein [Desulfurispira natronophila]MBB5021761.1 NADH-quinone oxidoreductase subunit H [Desulfurispira natronophila]
MTGIDILMVVLRVAFAIFVPLTFIVIFVWMERRGASFIQDRIGPNRANVGGFTLGGLVQPVADAVKLIFKEDLTPSHIKNKIYFMVAPALVFCVALLTFAVIPFADDITIGETTYMMQGIPTDVGILWFLGIAGFAVYGVIIAGWSSHNKFSMLGGLRATAQVVSFEIPLALAVIALLGVYGSIHLGDMVRYQGELLWGFIPAWGIILQPVGFVLFFITAVAEANRTPFDIAEGESEIVAGYFTEYSSMKFALFFMGEYVAMFVSSAIIVTLYLGGYHIPWLNTETLRENATLVAQTLLVLVPLFFGMFILWMRKNSRSHYDRPNDPRVREANVLTVVFIALAVVINLVLLLALSGGLGEMGAQILTMIIQIVVFIMKVFLVGFLYVWIRWTLPRFRYDTLQMLCWKVLLPIALVNILVTAVVVLSLQ